MTFIADIYGNSTDFDWTPYIGVWIACGVIGAVIGSSKRMGAAAGLIIGFLLGPIGLIVVAVSGRPSPLELVQTRPSEAGWHPDPLGRFDGRYFDGARWTQHVGRVEADGQRRQLEDPL